MSFIKMIRLPKGVNQEELLNLIRDIGCDVSRLLNAYNKNINDSNEFQNKLKIINHESGPVTAADLEINQLIKKKINDNYNGIDWDFLSEEDYKKNEKIKFKSKWVWIIDPIDGTKDFINQTGEYAVHIALAFGNEIILGLVPIPSKNQLWFFYEGKGTWLETRGYKTTQPIPRNINHLDDLIILTSKSHMCPEFKNLISEMKPKKFVGMGSVGYKIVSLLSGDANVYISYSSPNGSCPRDWDMAAPFSLIKGAGGYFTDLNCKELNFLENENFDQRGILIASININHAEICRQISEILKK